MKRLRGWFLIHAGWLAVSLWCQAYLDGKHHSWPADAVGVMDIAVAKS